MFRRVILISVLILMSGIPAWGDTVHTATGDVYKGTVTKRGKKVIVATKSGHVVLDAKIVILIEAAPVKEPVAKVETQPATPDPGGSTQSGDIATSSMFLKSGAMVLGNATRPEPIIYMNMRALPSAQQGAESIRIQRQIDLWRAHAHDRLRKTGQRWLSPKDFTRHRKMFTDQLAEADRLKALVGNTRRYSSSKTPPVLTAKQKRYLNQSRVEMVKAGRAWADMSTQHFLLGVAHMHSRNFATAEAAFKRGVKDAPLLAGVYQGLGLAQAKQYRYLSALEAFLEALRLKPDSAEALHLVRETMKQVPGRSIKSLLYKRAAETVMVYTTPPRVKSTSSYRTTTVEWLMPGGGGNSRNKGWKVASNTMPTPPYDRLEYRQAVGVPLGKHTIIVDAKTVAGALDVFVKIDGVFVPAKVGRSTYSSRKDPPKVATIYLTERVLTPVGVPTKESPVKPGAGTVHALGIFGPMDQKIRTEKGTFKPGGKDKPGATSLKLMPGESTSPIISADGKLVGFVAGKTTVSVDGAGPDKFITMDSISSIVKRATSSRSSIGRSSYDSAKREFTPKPAEGKTFVVYAILGETFKSGV